MTDRGLTAANRRIEALLMLVGIGTVSLLVAVAISTSQPPSFPAAADGDGRELSGTIALVTGAKSPPGEACVYVARASSEKSRQVTCTEASDGLSATFLSDGNIVLAQRTDKAERWANHDGRHASHTPGSTSYAITVIDVVSGAELYRFERRFVDHTPHAYVSPSPDRLKVSHIHGPHGSALLEDWRVRGQGLRRPIVSIPSRGDYFIASGVRSPDQRWIAFSDSENRVLIANRDGTNVRQLFQLKDVRRKDAHVAYEKSLVLWHQDGAIGESVPLDTLRNGDFTALSSVLERTQLAGNT